MLGRSPCQFRARLERLKQPYRREPPSDGYELTRADYLASMAEDGLQLDLAEFIADRAAVLGLLEC